MPKPKVKNQWKEGNKNDFVTTDPRFSRVFSDPRFLRPKKNKTKINIDKRFSQMLENEDFSVVGRVDKYGRKIKNSKSDIKRYYKIEDRDSDDEKELEVTSEESEEEEELENVENKKLDKGKEKEEEEEGSDEESESEHEIDYARGEGVLYSSSEDDWSDIEAEAPEVDIYGDVPTGDQTRRFAAVNLDWDKIRALDLFKLFDSFKPANGTIQSVKIYKSEFGKKRLEEESRNGPPAAIFGGKIEEDDEEEVTVETLVKEDKGEEFDNEELRKYQLERLKYYYAVVECDTVDTAVEIYNNCDGVEIEKSSNILDLRFIPDEETFDDEPVNAAYETPVAYEPNEFSTEALRHSKVKLTWDDDDPDRLKITRRKFTKEDLKNMDFQAYIASDEEDSEDDEEARERYKKLLLGNSDDEENEDNNQEMEITFAPGLSQAAKNILDKKKEKEELENETVFDAYLRKQREKKKAKREMKKKMNKEEESDDDDNLISDNEMDEIDMDDPFFAEAERELEESEEFKRENKESKKKNKKNRLSKEEREAKRKSKEELQLLMMDNSESVKKANEFDMKDVLKREKLQGKKKLKGKQKRLKKELAEDNFELNINDPRFSSVLTDHQFAIDPTMPQYKKTKNMEKLMEARQNQSKSSSAKEKIPDSDVNIESEKQEISSMVNSIKRKAIAMEEKKKKQRTNKF
ncbi:hypothetical protein BCR36DRAFT_325040 [Piromyces finnis]|uniref:Uncharacterized protein n=1 Tax=Piromyces finnis TaxID=1754191 RepID=A0A1Y1VC26_9FUNG|nr:hypothetical protein BCR36DRAFT_325040 [Piromyces finnis]|eukprot:ORX52211.1 hypothetical protein BCR36DRAFT_325040 [Piromyces finnis]